MESENVLDRERSTETMNEYGGKIITDGSQERMQGAVDIVDHYKTICDSRSDSIQPIEQCNEYSDCATSLPLPRKSSECPESPIKPLRKISQSSVNRKFSTSSDISTCRTPKKVSFSDELPIHSDDISEELRKNEHLSMLQRLCKTTMENSHIINSNDIGDDQLLSPSSSISTQTTNELTKVDMFPNSRKVSLHSEHSFRMDGPVSVIKPGTESAATQITTESESPMEHFIENERKMSTCSVKSKMFNVQNFKLLSINRYLSFIRITFHSLLN